MYNLFTLLVLCIVINKYTLREENYLNYLLLKNYFFPKIFYKQNIIGSHSPKEKKNIVFSKRVDMHLNPGTQHSFKFYLFFYKLLKRFFKANTIHLLAVTVYFTKHNVFLNKFYYDHSCNCWGHKDLRIFLYYLVASSNIFRINLDKNRLKYKNLKYKNLKYKNIFFRFKNIFNKIFKRINYNYNNMLAKLNLKYFFNIKKYFLRKTKCFNKSRYSRNRQNYRTGFYWCIYVNIIALVGLNFFFYKFIINFTMLWYLFYFFLFIFFFSKFFKYNLYYVYNIYNELRYLISLIYHLFKNNLFI
jgi:hypothetical protein